MKLFGLPFASIEIETSSAEEEIRSQFKGSCRTGARKAEREGMRPEAVTNDDLADDDHLGE